MSAEKGWRGQILTGFGSDDRSTSLPLPLSFEGPASPSPAAGLGTAFLAFAFAGCGFVGRGLGRRVAAVESGSSSASLSSIISRDFTAFFGFFKPLGRSASRRRLAGTVGAGAGSARAESELAGSRLGPAVG